MSSINQEQIEYKRLSIEIDLKEVLWKLFEQWKCVIVVALFMAILSSIAFGYRAQRIVEQKSSQATSEKKALATLSEDELQEVYYAIKLRNNYYNSNKHLQEAPLMKLNSNNVQQLTLNWLIAYNNTDAEFLREEIKNRLRSDDTVGQIIQETGTDIDIPSFRELVFFKDEKDAYMGDLIDNASFSLQCVLYLPDGVEANIVKRVMEDAFQAITVDLNKNEVNCKSVSAFSNTKTGASKELERVQNEYISHTINYRNSYYTVRQQLSSAQQTACDWLINETHASSDSKNNVNYKASWFTPKYLIMGAVCGVLLYTLLLLCYYVLSKRIIASNMIKDSLGLKRFGEFYTKDSGNKAFGLFCDRKVYNYHHRDKHNYEVQLTKAKTVIKECFRKWAITQAQLLVIGTSIQMEDSIIEKLCNQCRELGIELVKGDYNDDGLKSNQLDSGIIMVVSQYTRENEVRENIELVQQIEIPIYGYLYFG